VNNSLSGSALSYIPETAWNETSLEISQGGSLAASGGGVSKFFAKPSWQIGPTPADGQRDVPDLSFNAAFDSDSEGYLSCSQGSCVNGFRQANNNLDVVGGTSAGVPVFAGVVALLNQTTGARQGNVNPHLYQLAAASTDAFHDITSGDNIVPCKAGTPDCPSSGKYGFTAGPGYDLVTGLGSIDIYNFVTEWKSGASSTPPAPDFSMSGSVQTLSFTRTNSGTVNVSVAGTNGFSGTVTLTCSVPAALTNVFCAISPSTLSAGGSATVTISSTAISSLSPPPAPFRRSPSWNWMEGSLGAAFGLLLCKPAKKRKSRRLRMLRWGAVSAAALLMVAMTACGGGSSNAVAPTTTPTTTTTTGTTTAGPQTGTVVIQGTSHANIHIVPVTVTVN
jgi:subtilase family serine protease